MVSPFWSSCAVETETDTSLLSMFPRTCVKSDSNEYKSLSSPLEWKNNSSPLIAVFNPIKSGFLLITKRFAGRLITDEDNPSVETFILDPLAV